MLIILSGLPGVGKTTLAKHIARRVGGIHLRVDSIEQAIKNSSLDVETVIDAGYLVGYAVAKDNLVNGLSVIADSVNPIELTRTAWMTTAKEAGVPGIEVEIMCSDIGEHRKRVETRQSDIEGLTLPSWSAVQERDYQKWDRERIVIDTAHKDLEQTAEELLSQLPAGAFA